MYIYLIAEELNMNREALWYFLIEDQRERKFFFKDGASDLV